MSWVDEREFISESEFTSGVDDPWLLVVMRYCLYGRANLVLRTAAPEVRPHKAAELRGRALESEKGIHDAGWLVR